MPGSNESIVYTVSPAFTSLSSYFTFNESVIFMSSNVVFPLFVTFIVYSITSSVPTFVVSVISVNPSASFAFTAVASLFTNILGFCSTSTSFSGDLSPAVATL